MSEKSRSKSGEWVTILIAALAVLGVAYITLTDEPFEWTNQVISGAFLVFVLYNFFNIRGLSGKINALQEENGALQKSLEENRSLLGAAEKKLEAAEKEVKKQKSAVTKLKKQLKEATQE
jgi:peptidoglycan hydrolase CwlO-like protein